MADSGGHWSTLAEAQKLTSSLKIPGVFEEDIKRNNLIDRVPVAQAAKTGTKVEWLREATVIDTAVTETQTGAVLSWSDDVTYTEMETQLSTVYIQRKLDHFVEGIYGTYNNYEAQMLLECEKGFRRKLGARFVYGDYTYGGTPKQFDGLHAWAAAHGAPYTSSATSNDPKNIDGGETALSLQYMRIFSDAMLYGIDEYWMPFEIVRRFDAAYQEKGFAGLATATAGNLSFMTMGFNDAGKRVLFWDATPLVRSDFLVAEQVNTGTGSSSDARGLYASGTKQYSIFAIKKGSSDLSSPDPGFALIWGNTGSTGDLYKVVRFAELEDYDAGGIRLVSYDGTILKSSHCLGRIFDITDAALTV